MAKWKLQDPGNFRPAFHTAMSFAEGEHVLDRASTRQAAKALQEHWNVFRFCLRGHAHTDIGKLEGLYDRQTFVRHNHDSNRWELILTVSESTASVLRRVKFLPKSLDGLEEAC